MGEFTKGPWEAVQVFDADGEYQWMVQTETYTGGWELADIRMDVPDAEGNAHVMAAAPDLLAIAEICLKAEYERRAKLLPGAPATTYTQSRIDKIEAAIARARGGK